MTILQVTEIMRRLEQGMTRPFLVRAADDVLYVAKGRETTQRGLIAEWICAHLAQHLGLPIPAFTLLQVPPELVSALGPEVAALGHGAVFGSLQQTGVQEFAVTQLKRVDLEQQRMLLAFDWWVENADRSLSAHGGNPNLLWNAAQTKLLVIDHNLAFDADFDEASFFETHVFRQEAVNVFEDLVCRAETSERLDAALSCFDAAVQAIPPEWLWLDGEVRTLPVQVDFEALKRRLSLRARLERGFQ
ncbi:MAG: HipA family kinase [Limnohabitans sp.]